MNKNIVVLFLVCNLQIISALSMNHKQKVKNYQNNEKQTAYYMALLASELSIEQVNEFDGQFIQYKQDFLNIIQATDLYKQDPINLCYCTSYKHDFINLCNRALCQTGVTTKRLTAEAFLLLVKKEHEQNVMRKLLYSAVSQGHEKSVAFLFEQNVDLGDAQEEFTFLEAAYVNSHQGVVSMLLEKIAGVPDTRNDTKRWSLQRMWQSIIE